MKISKPEKTATTNPLPSRNLNTLFSPSSPDVESISLLIFSILQKICENLRFKISLSLRENNKSQQLHIITTRRDVACYVSTKTSPIKIIPLYIITDSIRNP